MHLLVNLNIRLCEFIKVKNSIVTLVSASFVFAIATATAIATAIVIAILRTVYPVDLVW